MMVQFQLESPPLPLLCTCKLRWKIKNWLLGMRTHFRITGTLQTFHSEGWECQPNNLPCRGYQYFLDSQNVHLKRHMTEYWLMLVIVRRLTNNRNLCRPVVISWCSQSHKKVSLVSNFSVIVATLLINTSLISFSMGKHTGNYFMIWVVLDPVSDIWSKFLWLYLL